MKLHCYMLLPAATLLVALGTIDCKRPSEPFGRTEATPTAAPAPVAPAAPAAPAQPDATPDTGESTAVTGSPPPLRWETPPPRPSYSHVWHRGYWRWDRPARAYVWQSGYWEPETLYAPRPPPPLRYEDPGRPPHADYVFVSGYWRWTGRDYLWMPGHWTLRREAPYYRHPRWEHDNGRWGRRFERSNPPPRREWNQERPHRDPARDRPRRDRDRPRHDPDRDRPGGKHTPPRS